MKYRKFGHFSSMLNTIYFERFQNSGKFCVKDLKVFFKSYSFIPTGKTFHNVLGGRGVGGYMTIQNMFFNTEIGAWLFLNCHYTIMVIVAESQHKNCRIKDLKKYSLSVQ